MALTSKQEHFSQLVALEGLNQSEAYRVAYDVSPEATAASTWTAASDLALTAEVALRIKELRESIVPIDWTLPRLMAEATANLKGAQADRQWAPANGALAFIGKTSGLVTDSPPPANPVTITKVTVMLDARSASLSLNSNATPEPASQPALNEADSGMSDLS